jgi:hypothetical protein
MYSLKILAPFLLQYCANEFVTGQGDYCVINQSPPQVTRYYEPGKSCYVNGTFHLKCENNYD